VTHHYHYKKGGLASAIKIKGRVKPLIKYGLAPATKIMGHTTAIEKMGANRPLMESLVETASACAHISFICDINSIALLRSIIHFCHTDNTYEARLLQNIFL
jgi:hypothetical protein